MAARITVNREQARQLTVFLRVPLDGLEGLADHLDSLSKPPVTVRKLQAVIEERLGASTEDPRIITRLLVTLALVCRQYGMDISNAANDLTDGLKPHVEAQSGDIWNQAQLDEWKERVAIVQRLLDSEPVAVAAKTVDLSFDYANLLQSVRILTDIRPIFDDTRGRLLGAIVSNILRVTYASEGSTHSVSIAIDERDIDYLHQACENALGKITAVKDLISKNELDLVIVGEESNALRDR